MIQSLYFIISIGIAISYIWLIIYILRKWNKADSVIAETAMPGFSYSIIIPARNEEKNITACIQSIISNYKFDQLNPEIIVIDDHSTDKTIGSVMNLDHPNITILHLEDYLKGRITNSFKKEAINYALQNANGDYIIQTDADCIFNANYLITIDNLLKQYQPGFAACPVLFYPAHNILEHFQVLDFTGMMGLTQAGIVSGKWYMANGANMVYKKQHGKISELTLASGDDVHRIETMANNPSNKIMFLKDKNLIVQTRPLNSITDLINQRIRWGTKNRKSRNSNMQCIAIIVYLNSLLICIHPFLAFALGPLALILFITHLFLKMSIDYIYLKELSDFFNSRNSMKYFVPASLLILLYISLIGTFSLFVNKYQWKGRVVQ